MCDRVRGDLSPGVELERKIQSRCLFYRDCIFAPDTLTRGPCERLFRRAEPSLHAFYALSVCHSSCFFEPLVFSLRRAKPSLHAFYALSVCHSSCFFEPLVIDAAQKKRDLSASYFLYGFYAWCLEFSSIHSKQLLIISPWQRSGAQ